MFPVNIDFDVDKSVERLASDMEHRYELLCIYKEAVTNAAKHANGRYVKVSLRYSGSKLIMMIIDDGKGFTMDEAAMLGKRYQRYEKKESGGDQCHIIYRIRDKYRHCCEVGNAGLIR